MENELPEIPPHVIAAFESISDILETLTPREARYLVCHMTADFISGAEDKESEQKFVFGMIALMVRDDAVEIAGLLKAARKQ